MHTSDDQDSQRRAKCLAYGLLVVAAITFTFELGRQNGISEAQRAAYEDVDGQAVATTRLMDEVVNQLRASDGAGVNAF